MFAMFVKKLTLFVWTFSAIHHIIEAFRGGSSLPSDFEWAVIYRYENIHPFSNFRKSFKHQNRIGVYISVHDIAALKLNCKGSRVENETYL